MPQAPDVRPSETYGYQPGQAFTLGGNQPGADGRFNIYDQGLPYSRVLGLRALSEPSYKETKDLRRFDATISSYTEWAQSIFDHLSRTNRGWPQLLRFFEQPDKPFLYEELSKQHIGGVILPLSPMSWRTSLSNH